MWLRSGRFLWLQPDVPARKKQTDRNADPAPVTEDAVIDEQQAQHLMQAVQRLRLPATVIIAQEHHEIAAALYMQESTVRQRIARDQSAVEKVSTMKDNCSYRFDAILAVALA